MKNNTNIIENKHINYVSTSKLTGYIKVRLVPVEPKYSDEEKKTNDDYKERISRFKI